jgi:hypothetical protein
VGEWEGELGADFTSLMLPTNMPGLLATSVEYESRLIHVENTAGEVVTGSVSQ